MKLGRKIPGISDTLNESSVNMKGDGVEPIFPVLFIGVIYLKDLNRSKSKVFTSIPYWAKIMILI